MLNEMSINKQDYISEEDIQSKSRIYFFFAFWVWIGFVSCIDTALSVKYRDQLIYVEENPIAVWILQMDDGTLAQFVAIKMFGTIIVLGCLITLLNFRMKWGLTVAVALAMFQACLLGYLFLL